MNLNPNGFRHWVDLGAPAADAATTFQPSRVKCAIQPTAPGSFDEVRTTHQVRMRYHPQVTFDTEIRFTDRASKVHYLYVKGIQNVEMANRELVLLCEEVMRP